MVNCVVGIDLGTSCTCVTMIFLNDNGPSEVRVLRFRGRATFPSDVSFAENASNPLVGQAAKNKVLSDPELTIHDWKRFIGRMYSDARVQSYIRRGAFSYKLVEHDKTGDVLVEMPIGGMPTFRTATQIACYVLKQARKMVEGQLSGTNQRIVKVVIGVPVHAGNDQLKATLEAARLAGFDAATVRLLAEPLAAAYGQCTEQMNGSNILVYDLGGGTFDVSLLKVHAGKKTFEVLAKNGDDALGGREIDLALRDYFVELIKELIYAKCSGEVKERMLAKCKEPRILNNLCERAEEVKIQLSYCTKSSLYLPSLGFEGLGELYLTRADFEAIEAVNALLQRTIKIVAIALDIANLRCSDIDVIVLAGGASQMPAVRDALEVEFDLETGSKRIRDVQPTPEEAMAHGAALYALQLVKEAEKQMPDSSSIIDITSLDISVGIRYYRVKVVISRCSRIPVEQVHKFETVENDQQSITFKVYEGASLFCERNNLVDEFVLSGLPKRAAGDVVVEVKMKLDANGILQVTASHGTLCSRLDIDYKRKCEGRRHRVHEMLAYAQANSVEEQRKYERLEHLSHLEKELSNIHYRLDAVCNCNASQQRELERCRQVEAWLLREKHSASKEQLIAKKAELLS